MTNKTLSYINKITGGSFKKTELLKINKKTLSSKGSNTVISIKDNIVEINKAHTPSLNVLHSKANLYRTVRAVWDLADAMDIILSHDDIKNHVDKYVNAGRDEANTVKFSEVVNLTQKEVKHKVLGHNVQVKHVIIGANISGDTVIPFIDYEYTAKMEV